MDLGRYLDVLPPGLGLAACLGPSLNRRRAAGQRHEAFRDAAVLRCTFDLTALAKLRRYHVVN